VRLNIVKLLVDVLGKGIHFSYAENRNQASEKALASIQNFSMVIVEESNEANNLLKWLKTQIKVPITVLLTSTLAQSTSKRKFIDFLWTNQLPSKQEFNFSLMRSSNECAVRLITHVKYTVDTTCMTTAVMPIKVLIIAPNLSKSKMISKQLQSALLKLSSSVDVVISTNGSDAIDMIYDSHYNMIMIDNSFGKDLGEVLHHIQYRFLELLRPPMIIGMTTSSALYNDYLTKNGCDMIWQLPLPSTDILASKMRKFIHLNQ
jgi:hypothetical protein